MGYLNNSTITVDAILTKKGRELLAGGNNVATQITKFAVADDEIDYSLYDVAHPLGTAYYGSAIENMPIVEASVDETQNMRYKLVTLDRRTVTNIPKLSGDFTAVSLTYSRQATAERTINVSTLGGFDSTDGYTAILYNADAADISAGNGDALNTTATLPRFLGDSLTSTAKVVTSRGRFIITPKQVNTETPTQLVIVGNETGATVTIPVTIFPENT